MTPLLLLFGAVVVFTAIAAYTDLRTGLIPNRLLLAGFILALPLHTAAHFLVLRASGEPASEVMLRAVGYYGAGVGVCGLVPYILFRYGAMGGGDVKLLAMVGAFVGPIVGLEIELYALVITALFAGARFAYQGRLTKLLSNSLLLLTNAFRKESSKRPMPPELMSSFRFAPAVFASALLLTGLRVGMAGGAVVP